MPTNQQLKLALARMLPEKIQIFKPLDQRPAFFAWYDEEGDTSNYINDTEWLHVCWLVEQTLDKTQQLHYIERLVWMLDPNDAWPEVLTVSKGWFFLNATWQQRAEALCRVKGIEI